MCLDFSKSNSNVLTVGSSTFNYTSFGYRVRKIEESFPLTDVGNTTTIVGFREQNAAKVTDALAEIEYPRLFNFGNPTTFEFKVLNTAPTLLNITGFNAQSTIPVLYDLDNNERYIAIVNGSNFQLK